MGEGSLKAVELVNPKICLACRFRGQAEVKLTDGSVQIMRLCHRGDCDNWITSTAEDVVSIRPEPEN